MTTETLGGGGRSRAVRGAALLGLALAAGLLAGCLGPYHRMDTPPGFRRYRDAEALKMITADGVMLKAREVENYPEADLGFWAEALARHLQSAGYTKSGELRFTTEKGLAGRTLEFVLPVGAEDWVMSETLFVVGERIALVEVAGPFERYARFKPGLEKALRTFDPGG